MILDGELVAFDAAGKPSFATLQDRAQLKTEREIAAADLNAPVVPVLFDLLHFAGIDLRKSAYRDRRRYLAQCLLPSARVQLVHAADDGVALSAAALASRFEGVVGKRLESRYEAGRRSTSWLKVKPTSSADFVVGGYTKGKGARAPLDVLVGYWEDGGELRYASHVGSGFDKRSLVAVKARLAKLQRKACPFVEIPEQNAPTTWVELEIVAEVNFQSWTQDDHLRAPVLAAPARRRRSEVGAAVRARRRAAGDRRNRGATAEQEDCVYACRGNATDELDQPGSRLLARGSRAQASGVHQARPADLPGAGFAVHAAASRESSADDDSHA